MLTPPARAEAAYAPALTVAAYTYIGSLMRMRYFSSVMTRARYFPHVGIGRHMDSSQKIIVSSML
jgi:hypothetical protein